MIRRIWLGLLLFLAACGTVTPSPTPTPAPTGTPSPVPTATFTPTPTATPTLTPTATTTATPSPVPSATSTPLPSPTPRGYYAHQTAGFDLIYPTGWHILQEDTESVALGDEGNSLTLLVARDTTPGDPTFQTEVDEFVSGLASQSSSKRPRPIR